MGGNLEWLSVSRASRMTQRLPASATSCTSRRKGKMFKGTAPLKIAPTKQICDTPSCFYRHAADFADFVETTCFQGPFKTGNGRRQPA